MSLDHIITAIIEQMLHQKKKKVVITQASYMLGKNFISEIHSKIFNCKSGLIRESFIR